jgi:hypothetical protein
MKTVKQLKCELYHRLLQIEHQFLTDNEVEIMFSLAKDSDVQDVLSMNVKGSN